MHGRTRALLAIAAAILMPIVGAASSLAVTATTWTVKPGGDSSGSTKYFVMRDTKTGGGFACSSSSLSVRFKSGSGLSGSDLGLVTSISATNCNFPAGYGFTFSHLPYVFSATSYSSGTTTGKITGIHAKGTGTGCEFVMDGTSASADNGYVVVTYSNSSGKLKVNVGGNLHFYDVSGCYGLLGSGDRTNPEDTGPYGLSPKQTITSP